MFTQHENILHLDKLICYLELRIISFIIKQLKHSVHIGWALVVWLEQCAWALQNIITTAMCIFCKNPLSTAATITLHTRQKYPIFASKASKIHLKKIINIQFWHKLFLWIIWIFHLKLQDILWYFILKSIRKLNFSAKNFNFDHRLWVSKS